MEIISKEPVKMIHFEWSVTENEYSYMDTWIMPESEWSLLTLEDIKSKQIAQYDSWKKYMLNPET